MACVTLTNFLMRIMLNSYSSRLHQRSLVHLGRQTTPRQTRCWMRSHHSGRHRDTGKPGRSSGVLGPRLAWQSRRTPCNGRRPWVSVPFPRYMGCPSWGASLPAQIASWEPCQSNGRSTCAVPTKRFHHSSLTLKLRLNVMHQIKGLQAEKARCLTQVSLLKRGCRRCAQAFVTWLGKWWTTRTSKLTSHCSNRAWIHFLAWNSATAW
mmetsp:Transcript_119379/g.237922  ORF Transcript_119379/g.237922 Transcript_119379/m.237922 type:complete len:208 (+) Transcript_119379:1715-2338(+)